MIAFKARHLIFFLGVIITGLINISISPFFSINGITPNIAIIFICLYLWKMPINSRIIQVFFAGVILDLINNAEIIGYTSMLFLIIIITQKNIFKHLPNPRILCMVSYSFIIFFSEILPLFFGQNHWNGLILLHYAISFILAYFIIFISYLIYQEYIMKLIDKKIRLEI